MRKEIKKDAHAEPALHLSHSYHFLLVRMDDFCGLPPCSFRRIFEDTRAMVFSISALSYRSPKGQKPVIAVLQAEMD